MFVTSVDCVETEIFNYTKRISKLNSHVYKTNILKVIHDN